MKTPNGLSEIIATFGDARKMSPADFERLFIVRVVLPESLEFETLRVTRITAHRLLAPHLSDTLKQIHDAGLWHALEPYGGGYANRPQRGSSKLSLHAWGISFDFNPDAYPLGSSARMPDDLVSIFTSNGFVYGGDFVGRKDPQHVQFASGA